MCLEFKNMEGKMWVSVLGFENKTNRSKLLKPTGWMVIMIQYKWVQEKLGTKTKKNHGNQIFIKQRERRCNRRKINNESIIVIILIQNFFVFVPIKPKSLNFIRENEFHHYYYRSSSSSSSSIKYKFMSCSLPYPASQGGPWVWGDVLAFPSLASHSQSF